MIPIRFVCATRRPQHEFITETALGRSLALYRHVPFVQFQLFAENRNGLPLVYNAALEFAKANPAILVFIHDDVTICDFFWADRLRAALDRFDVVGVAGNKRRLPKQPAWIFSGADFAWDESQYLSGVVGHGKGFPCEIVSAYGPADEECKLLDGLMLAAYSQRLNESGMRFDERFDFHFYDMDFCRQAELRGLRMGTLSISVVHESGGAYASPAWSEAYARYLEKYGE